ncbi:MAG: HAMP domain-containing histidine kinase [Synechococcaceae cyanobacterium SM2_3_1]|nr:HAMP domain-containing histidine kinase [Synechococcaceae cyanobacterium SM2_3_1]
MDGQDLPSLCTVLWSQRPLPEWIPGVEGNTWMRVITALCQLWCETGQQGIVVSGPQIWLPYEAWPEQVPVPLALPPANPTYPAVLGEVLPSLWLFTSDNTAVNHSSGQQVTVSLPAQDPLLQEQFLLLLTPLFAAVAVQGIHPRTGQPGIMVSFEPEVLRRVCSSLSTRIGRVGPERLAAWDLLLHQFPRRQPHYRLVTRYSSLLLLSGSAGLDGSPPAQLPATVAWAEDQEPETQTVISSSEPEPDPDAESEQLSETRLLRALMHEVLTPLTVIRTHIHRALKQPSLPAKARESLERAERECKEQINRFNLFFQATEPQPKRLHLEPTALVDLVRQNLPQWQDQVRRRGSELSVDVPDDLPDVVSDPQTLNSVLFGLIDRIARISPPGSQIRAQLVSAGEQVKLQFHVDSAEDRTGQTPPHLSPLQAIGQLLVLQPDTGAISLSLPVTRTLFRALGGHLTFRQKAQQGETFTIYLPRQL